MEQRKLIKLGNSSFAIALPKDWIEKAGLKKGDDIFLERNGNGELAVMPNFKEVIQKKIEINTDNNDENSIKKNIRAAYIRGYNLIELKGSALNNKFIKKVIEDYPSFEVVESDDKKVVLKDFFDIKEAKFENFVRRIDNDLREMFFTIVGELKKKRADHEILKEINEIDKSINKFYFLCSRIFIKGIDNPSVLNLLKMNGNRLFSNWWISFNLESIGDNLKYAFELINKLSLDKKEGVNDIIVKLQKNYIKSMESFYQDDQQKSLEVLDETKKNLKELERLERKDIKINKIIGAFESVKKSIYQNAKMIVYVKY